MPIEFRGYVGYYIGLVLTPTPVTSLPRDQVSTDHPERQASMPPAPLHTQYSASPLEKGAL